MARLHYLGGQAPGEIGRQLHLSPSAVTRIIQVCREQGIVEFSVGSGQLRRA